jgi:hypothetical protein
MYLDLPMDKKEDHGVVFLDSFFLKTVMLSSLKLTLKPIIFHYVCRKSPHMFLEWFTQEFGM